MGHPEACGSRSPRGEPKVASERCPSVGNKPCCSRGLSWCVAGICIAQLLHPLPPTLLHLPSASKSIGCWLSEHQIEGLNVTGLFLKYCLGREQLKVLEWLCCLD